VFRGELELPFSNTVFSLPACSKSALYPPELGLKLALSFQKLCSDGIFEDIKSSLLCYANLSFTANKILSYEVSYETPSIRASGNYSLQITQPLEFIYNNKEGRGKIP
jgi:hypothetical protein